jgi:hypothetical protein
VGAEEDSTVDEPKDELNGELLCEVLEELMEGIRASDQDRITRGLEGLDLLCSTSNAEDFLDEEQRAKLGGLFEELYRWCGGAEEDPPE